MIQHAQRQNVEEGVAFVALLPSESIDIPIILLDNEMSENKMYKLYMKCMLLKEMAKLLQKGKANMFEDSQQKQYLRAFE